MEKSYQTVSKVCGIWKPTVIKIVQAVTYELVLLSSSFIKFRQTTLEHAIALGAFSKFLNCKIPQVVGPFFITMILHRNIC